MKRIFNITRNGEAQRVEFPPGFEPFEKFNRANSEKHPVFGSLAMAKGEAPFKAVCTFTDGSIVGFRGDKFVFPNYVEMLKSLYKMVKKFLADGKLYQVKIYDNRNILMYSQSEILFWNKDKGTVINLLPYYSGEFDLTNKNQ